MYRVIVGALADDINTFHKHDHFNMNSNYAFKKSDQRLAFASLKQRIVSI